MSTTRLSLVCRACLGSTFSPKGAGDICGAGLSSGRSRQPASRALVHFRKNDALAAVVNEASPRKAVYLGASAGLS